MYTPTVWQEHSMTTAQKLTALDNLEEMYTEAVAYIDGITHSSLYYTDAQASAKFFTSATDGSGSGLIAATLDGMGADQIIAAGTPSGNIAWWSGSEASIPSGWVLCNGLNGTPDLRSRFVVGAGLTYAIDATGGSTTATPTASSVTIATFALTGTHLPSHRHAYYDYYRSTVAGTGYIYYVGVSVDHIGLWTNDDGASTAHGHPGSSFSGDACNTLPKHWALCAIRKI